jgi:3,4-dihydroxy 2-butanone 4-phosphate synthase / GTP cyclohydrolase II
VTGTGVMDSATTASTTALFPDQSPVTRSVSALRNGEAVVLVGRRRGDIVIAADAMNPSLMSFLVRHTSGLVFVAMPVARTLELGLPSMVAHGRRPRESPTVTVDAVAGVGTGISAADRSRTVRCLAAQGSRPDDFSRPGHLLPVAIDLASDIGKPTLLSRGFELGARALASPAVASATVVSVRRTTELADRDEVILFARARGLAYLIVDDD